MKNSILYRKIVRAAALLAVLGMACCIWMSELTEVRAQGCSRNMLRTFGPQSYVATPDARALHLTNGFTIECWVRVDRVLDFSGIVDKGSYGIFLNTDSGIFGMVRKTNPFDVATSAIDSLQNWHHVALTFTPGDSLRFYLDSSEVASAKVSALSIDSNTDSLKIGISIAGTEFLGSIDELRIWNVPRSLAQIKQTLFLTLAGNDSGLVLYYPFDDATGSLRVHDFSGHGRDGFLRGTSTELIPSSSPIRNGSPGYRLVALESKIVIPTRRCTGSFDTVVHVRNLGSDSLYVDTVGFSRDQAFSIVPNSPFWLPPDSTKIDSLRLHFEPNAGGFYFDSLYISSSSDCAGKIRIAVEATYDSVGLTVNTDTVRFGAHTQCSRDTLRTVTLRNTSVTDSVTIRGVTLPPGAGLHVLDSFPITLAKEGSVPITIALGSGSPGPMTVVIAFDLDKCARQALVNVSAVRERDQLSMPGVIDFGSVPDSLGGVTRDTIVVVKNTGDVITGIYGIKAGPPTLIAVTDGRTGNIKKIPGDTLQVHVRMHVSECGVQNAKVSIQSSECLVDTTTLLTINVISPAPLTAPSLDMGVACSPRDTTIYISNPNDRPIRLDSISYAPNFAFSNSPILFDTIPARDSIPIPFQFNPNQDGNYTDTVFFHSSPCGIGTAIFRGAWGYEGLSFGTPQLLFGRGCKTDSIRKTATLTNSTSRSITIGSNTYKGSARFEIDPFSLPITLPPGASKTFAILYLPTLEKLDTGTFEFLSSDGCTAATLSLRGSREIAKAAWESPMGEFDTICPGDSSMKIFDLSDRGIDSLDVRKAVVTGAGFSLVHAPPSAFSGAGHFQILFTPQSEQEYSGELIVTVDSCGNSFTLPLHGSGGPRPRITFLDTVYEFGNVLVGDSGLLCFTVTNPSCTAIELHADSSSLDGTPFSIHGAASSAQIARGDTANLCLLFRPNTYGAAIATLTLVSDSAPSRIITLRGVGLAPDVRFHPQLLDFGYVLRNTSKAMMLYDTNAGNLAASIVASNNNSVFSVEPPNLLGPLASDSFRVSFNPALVTGLAYDTLRLRWNGHEDNIILRGFGTEKGLQLSAVGLDFGNVHIGHDSTQPLYLYATNNFPTIDSIRIQTGISTPRDTFFEVPNRVFPYSIQSDSDTLAVSVTYHARLEQADTSYLVIYTGGNSTIVPLSARGVEAHPRVNATLIDFGPVVLGTSLTIQPVRLTNVGGYQMFVGSLPSDSIFITTPDLPTVAILPDSSRLFTITFRPNRARRIEHLLQLSTSSPDAVPPVLLIGTGIYPAGTGPSFEYSVASITTEPGEFDTIPVSMSGIRLDKIDADSATLEIRFDPEMVRILGADGGLKTIPVSRFTMLNDSTAEVSVARNTFGNDTILRLHTEALLGPHPLSFIHVLKAAPTPDQLEAAGDGQFFVADCGGAIHGVVFAGPYLTNAIVPNPAGDRALLQFTLGLDGLVEVDIYNSIGQSVKRVDAGLEKAGPHSLPLDVSDLPQGRYVYRLTSLDYHAEGALTIMR